MDARDATERIRRAGLDLGFARVGFARAERFEAAAGALRAWLERGYHGEMRYLDQTADRADPLELLPTARSLIVVALAHGALAPLKDGSGRALTGHIAAYAKGDDYHRVLKDKLRALAVQCEATAGRPVASRVCVDTAPLLEREAARRAGIGFTGKSAMTIVPGIGTSVLLGVLLVDQELVPDEPLRPACGQCTACIDRCPTGAFVAPGVIDARRCIAYLTIEHRGPIDESLRPLMGTHVFGCDVCQQVCPFNGVSGRGASPELAPRSDLDVADLVSWLELGSARYRKLVEGTALRRTHRPQLARNAAIALGNTGDPRAVAPLVRALKRDRHALVRRHVAWALGRLGGRAAAVALDEAAREDEDADVRTEAARAKAHLVA